MNVTKRDGSKQQYDVQKIKKCILSANKEVEEADRIKETEITDVLYNVNKKVMEFIADNDPVNLSCDISVEDIQDIIEDELVHLGKYKLVKRYIQYRDQHERARETEKTLINYKNVMDNYLNVNDWRVKENSTVSYSIGGLILSNSGAVTANYWLSEVYDEEIANAHRNADIHIHDLSMLSGYCFTGDTRIKTLDGRNPTFKELVDNNEDSFWVYSYDNESGEVVPAKANSPRVTRKIKELVKVTLTSGKTILCTADHPFMTRDGSYVKASELKPNMSLMPLYIGDGGKYVTINKAWNNQNKKEYLHRWIASKTIGRPLFDGEVVHHINGDKHDNRPDNLEILFDKEHRKLEILKTMNGSLWKENNHKRLCEYNRSNEKRHSVSILANERERNSNGQFIKFSYHKNNDLGGTSYNHCVRKIEKIKLDTEIDVYDITVPKYHNFALDAGVFVHNCAGWSLKQLIQEGLGGVPGKIASKPASHLHTLCNQMVNFLGIMQNEWAGKI